MSAVELADRVWWVGSVQPDEVFQCHAYLVVGDEGSVLIDPGSTLTIDRVMQQVCGVIDPADIRWIVCHHSDPDIAGSLPHLRTLLPRPDLQVVTEWRAATLLRHYDAHIPFHLIEEHDWQLPIDETRRLRFVLTPYLHFPGAMCSYEKSTGVLFTSDLFGGFTDGTELFAKDMSYFESMRSFHEHYMPSNEILISGLERLRSECSPIRMIAPQHGCIIPEPLVEPMFEALGDLECGIFLMARDDLDVSRLLRLRVAMRMITDALVMAHDLPELAATAERVLPGLMPVEAIELYAELPDEGVMCFSRADTFDGAPRPVPQASGVVRVLEVPGDGVPAWLVLRLAAPLDQPADLQLMFERLAPALRAALERHLERRRAEREHDQLRDSATHDALTGLYNRHALELFARPDLSMAVLMIDIDLFKGVNDQFGHDVGDLVLRRVANEVLSVIRPDDAAIRYGGEEFLVVLKDLDPARARSVAERIRDRVRRLSFVTFGGPSTVTVSIGVALHAVGSSVAASITTADRCLYAAKRGGRDQVRAEWDVD